MNIYESIKSFTFNSDKKSMAEGLEVQDSPNIEVNLPLNAGLAFNFVPNLADTKGEFTDLEDEEPTVKADPFSDSVVPNPEDPDTDKGNEDEIYPEEGDIETVTDSDEARFLTLQDLM